MKKMFLVFLLFLVGCSAEGINLPGSIIDRDPAPGICEQEEYSGSNICAMLESQNITAEDARDMILDANAIALITEVYTVDDIKRITAAADGLLSQDGMTYSRYFEQMKVDYVKAKQVAGILDRRFGGITAFGTIVAPDIELLRLLNTRIREAS